MSESKVHALEGVSSSAMEYRDQEIDLLIQEKKILERDLNSYVEGEEVGSQWYKDWVEVLKIPIKERRIRYDKMIKRVFAETSSLDDLKDTVLEENLLGDIANGQFPTKVIFDQSKNLNKDLPSNDFGIAGKYNIDTEEIFIGKPATLRDSVWVGLSAAEIPDEIKTLDHELVHFFHDQEVKSKLKESVLFKAKRKLFFSVLQFTEPILNFKISRRFTEKVLDPYLKRLVRHFSNWEDKVYDEVVAQKAGTYSEKNKYTTKELISRLLIEPYGFDSEDDIDFIILASQAVDRMRALNLSDKEITEAFVGAKYDEENISIPQVDSKILELAAQRGITIDDVDYLVDKMRVTISVNMLRATKIAQEELADFAKEARHEK